MNTNIAINFRLVVYLFVGLVLALSIFQNLFFRSVSAASLTSKSIQMSTATPSATSVKYKVTFTNPTGSANSLVIDFCSGSPIVGATCTTPTGMGAGSSITYVSGQAGGTNWGTPVFSAGQVKIPNNTGTAMSAGGTQVFEVNGITNPSTTGVFYARIYTFSNNTYGTYSSAASPGNYLDSGGLALSTNAVITITATVQEVLVFCVDGATTSAAVTCPTPTSPNLTLGSGTPAVIGVSGPFTGSIFSHLQTNASSGVSINLKTTGANATCAGLYNSANTASCAIPGVGATANALTTSPTAPSTGSFGVKAVQLTDGTGATGTLTSTSPYDTANYAMKTAVYGTYGDTLASSTSAAYYKNTQYTFAAVSAAGVPAGTYTNTFDLIATGNF